MEHRKPRSPGRYRRNKGKRGELMLRDVLRAAGWPETERGQQRAGGGDAPDVRYGPERVHFECKNVETFNARKALAQAIGDAAPGSMPIVAQKCTRGPWIAVLKLDDLLDLLKFRDLFEGRGPAPKFTPATAEEVVHGRKPGPVIAGGNWNKENPRWRDDLRDLTDLLE